MGGTEGQALAELRKTLIDGRGVAEPRTVAAALAATPIHLHDDPICRLAEAVVARPGDVDAADPLHRAAAAALADDPAGLAAVMASWIGSALARHDVAVLSEISALGQRLDDLGEHDAAQAVNATLTAAACYAVGDFSGAETTMTSVNQVRLPSQLRGVVAWMRALSMQARGLLEASMAILDAAQPHLGVFDLPADVVRANGLWMSGSHDRARELLVAVHTRGRELGRQHDVDYAAAVERLIARLDGGVPALPTPALPVGHIAEMVLLEEALVALPDEEAAATILREEPPIRFAVPALLAIRYVLCPRLRDEIDERTAAVHDPSGALDAARALVVMREGRPASAEAWQLRSLPPVWRHELVPQVVTAPRGVVSVNALGAITLVAGGTRHSIRRERVRALIAALAYHRTLTRAHLGSMLWPELDASAVANNLRVTLSYARRAVLDAGGQPEEVLHADRSFVTLLCPVDLWELDRTVSAARSSVDGGESWMQAADLAQGRFAPDVDGGDWLDVAQRSVEATVVEALWRGATAARARGAWDAATAWAQQAVELDPWCEPAWETLVGSLTETGNHGAARAQSLLAVTRLDEIGVTFGGNVAEVGATDASAAYVPR